MSNLHEECGVFGAFSPKKAPLASMAYYALYALQHRGQESCGIVVNTDGKFKTHKDVGLVQDVFTRDIMESYEDGQMAIGHVRYGTAGTVGRSYTQPVVVDHMCGGMALCHNGNLANAKELRKVLEEEGSIFHTHRDTEVIAYVIVNERLRLPSIEQAVNSAMYKLGGAYSFVIMTRDKLLAVRDPHGFRPLCYGITEDGTYVVASESCALDSVGAEFVRDVKPGEIVVFDKNGVRSIEDHCGKCPTSSCVFEFIYFARPDSVIDGSSVHNARLRAGAFLALEHPVHADVVIGVPDSGIDAAIGYSRQSGIPYMLGFIKNKYIGRTFIAPGQSSREDKVRIKLNPISSTVKGKRVVLIDDSIVRGTTCARIVKLLREAGATEVHMRVTAPPFVYPCYYGTDIDSSDKLIAYKHSLEEIEKIIDVDSLGYLSVANAKQIAENTEGFCTACFTGKYPTELPWCPLNEDPIANKEEEK